jgi:hypothetical protein
MFIIKYKPNLLFDLLDHLLALVIHNDIFALDF